MAPWDCFRGCFFCLQRPAVPCFGRPTSPEEIVRFFEREVSLIRQQLPRAEIFKLAAMVTPLTFKPGDFLARQGEMGHELLFIFHGEVLIERCEPGAEEVRGSLIRGSFWGDGSIVRNHPSAATLEAIQPVVALSLSREAFQRLGLQQKLNFIVRPAVYANHPADVLHLDPEEEDFVVSAVKANANLGKALSIDDEVLRGHVRRATLVKYGAGAFIAKWGEHSRAAFIVRSGNVEVLPRSADRRSGSSPASRGGRENTTSNVSGPGDQAHENLLQKEEGLQKELLNGSTRILGPGDVFGELSLLHNTRRVATFRVAEGSDAEVYMLLRRDFKRCFYDCRSGTRKKEVLHLLDDVPFLSSLFKFQRNELALNNSGFETFAPGQVVLEAGQKRVDHLWYVIATGSAEQYNGNEMLPRLSRGDHFGLRSVMLDAPVSVTVQAGPEGLTCLCFEGELIMGLELAPEHLASVCLETAGEVVEAERRRSRLPTQAMVYAEQFDASRLESVGYLGRGQFGLVILQKDPITGKQYALKRVSKGLAALTGAEKMISFEKDLTILLSSCMFTVTLHSTWRDEEFLYLVQDAELGGSLRAICEDRPEVLLNATPPSAAALFYTGCMVEALSFLHEFHVVFRDLKPDNVLLDARGYAKFCDFGLSRYALAKMKDCAGSPGYMAPEMRPNCCSKGYDLTVDWWALGCIVFELLSPGNDPFPSDQDGFSILGASVNALPASAPAAAVDFVRKLLVVDPERRLGRHGPEEIRDHAWFAELDVESLKRHSLPAPYIPPPFETTIPAPALWRDDGSPIDVVFTEHVGVKLEGTPIKTDGGIDSVEEGMATCAALSTLDNESGLVSFSVFRPNGASKNSGKTLVQLYSGWEPKERWGWTSYRCHSDLFAPYSDDGSGWDRNFERCPTLATPADPGVLSSKRATLRLLSQRERSRRSCVVS